MYLKYAVFLTFQNHSLLRLLQLSRQVRPKAVLNQQAGLTKYPAHQQWRTPRSTLFTTTLTSYHIMTRCRNTSKLEIVKSSSPATLFLLLAVRYAVSSVTPTSFFIGRSFLGAFSMPILKNKARLLT